MADEESNYKVEYLDCAEDAPEEERVFTWIARAGKARVTVNSPARSTRENSTMRR